MRPSITDVRSYTSTSSNQDAYFVEGEDIPASSWIENRTEKKVTSIKDILAKQQAAKSSKESTHNKDTDISEALKEIRDEQMLKEMNASQHEIHNNVPIDRANLTLTTLVRVCGRLSDDSDIGRTLARELMAGVVSKNGLVTADTCHKVMRKYVSRGNQTHVVERLFDMLVRHPSEIIDASEMRHTDIVESFNILIDSYATSGSLDKCRALLAEMETRGVAPSDETWVVVIRGMAACNRPDEAMAVYGECVGRLTNVDSKVAALGHVIYCHARNKQVDRVEQIYDMIKSGMGIDATPEIAQNRVLAHLNTDDISGALAILATDAPTTTRAFHLAFEWLGRAHRLQDMMTLFTNEMCRPGRQLVESYPVDTFYPVADSIVAKWRPNINTLNVLIEACCRCNDLDHAFELFHQLTPRYQLSPSSETFSSLEGVCLRLNQMAKYSQHCGSGFHIIKKKDDD
eukprot:gene13316-15656_t